MEAVFPVGDNQIATGSYNSHLSALLRKSEKGKALDLRYKSYYLPVRVFQEITFTKELAGI